MRLVKKKVKKQKKRQKAQRMRKMKIKSLHAKKPAPRKKIPARNIARKKKPVKKEKRAMPKRIPSKILIPKRVETVIKKLPEAPEDKHFVLRNGKKLRNIWDLMKSLEKMNDEIFSYHVTPYKNDFCAWIYHVFNEVELARMLANEKNKKNTIIIIKEYYRK
ncbi:MAG: hypothetical protein V1743_08475 [Nanoarchaeota archaeon]